MRRPFNSLRSRILLCVLLAGLLPVVLMNVIIENTCKASLIDQRKIEIRQRCSLITTQLGGFDDIDQALTGDNIRLLNWYSECYGGRLLVIDEQFRILLDTYNAHSGETCISDAVFQAFQGKEYQEYREDTESLEFVLPVKTTQNQEEHIIGTLVFSSTTAWISEGMKKLYRMLLIIECIWCCLTVFAAVYLSYLIVHPVNDVARKISRLNEGHRDISLENIDSYQEIDDILDASAQVVQHYKELEESQEQFVSNVSHELRTPMTSARVLSDSLIGQENVPEEMYQEFLLDISNEIERENNIIEDLLSMIRLGKSSDSMNITRVNINEFLLKIMHRIRPIAESRKIEMIYETFRQVNADVDEIKLSQACSNLIENAVKYNAEGGYVKVSLDADHEYFYMKVADNGIGIPEDAMEHIFERFYRVDKARSRETGGTGLGLSITRSIILLHYGVIKAESTPGKGTVFTVRIPLNHVDLTGGRS